MISVAERHRKGSLEGGEPALVLSLRVYFHNQFVCDLRD